MIKKFLNLVMWNCALILIVIFFAELIFGLWAWGDPVENLNIPRNLKWEFSVNHLYPGRASSTYTRDKWGFRGNIDALSEIDVLVIGGSTSDERFIDDTQTWPSRLQGCLINKGYSYKIANAGVTGQSTVGHNASFDLWFSQLENLKPKYIIAFIGVNDIIAKPDDFVVNDVTRFNEHANSGSFWAVSLQHIKMKSSLYRLFRTVRGQIRAYQAGVAYEFGDGQATPKSILMAQEFEKKDLKILNLDSKAVKVQYEKIKKLMEPQIRHYRNQLLKLEQNIRKLGAQPIFVTQAWGTYRREANEVAGDVETYFRQSLINAQTMRHCKKAGMRCFDFGNEVGFQAGDTYDTVHTTPQGSNKVARFLCQGWPFPLE